VAKARYAPQKIAKLSARRHILATGISTAQTPDFLKTSDLSRVFFREA
jgi:hypothetical protein|tara:strand:- start:731 stop:874 length:144 start_codon:yes stop_codon:yes gene_type:complete